MLATDPESGRTEERQITRTIRTDDDKAYVDITVKGDDKRDRLTATDHHKFWSATRRSWVDAGDLKPGELLRTSAGTYVQVGAVRKHHAEHITYDLTVDEIHTYHVLVGGTPLLVHNNNDDLCEIARQAAAGSNTSNTGVAAARDTYTGEFRTGESGAVPGNVNPGLVPGLRQAQDMQANGVNLEPWDPGTCVEFHACNNVMNDVGANLDELEYGTVRKEDGSPFPSCGWCRLILIGGGATERTP